MKRTTTAMVAGLALAGLAGVGIASAATANGPAGRIGEVLASLVQKGTITQGQADAVQGAIDDAREKDQSEREARRAERQAEVDTLLESTLGLTRDEVVEKLREGRTLKEIAGDKADELAAGAKELAQKGLDEAVADGRMTQAQADALAKELDSRVDAWLAGADDGRGPGVGLGLLLGGTGRGMGHGHGPMHGWGRPDGEESSSGSSGARSSSDVPSGGTATTTGMRT